MDIISLMNILTSNASLALLLFASIYPFVREKFHDFINLSKDQIMMFIGFGSIIVAVIYSYYGFPACSLCWVQRVLFAIIGLLGIFGYLDKFSSRIPGLIISFIGIVIASYQYFIQIFPPVNPTIFCEIGSVACTSIYVLEYGFITIPFMSLCLFAFIFSMNIFDDPKSYKKNISSIRVY